jgi:hypothetical protein
MPALKRKAALCLQSPVSLSMRLMLLGFLALTLVLSPLATRDARAAQEILVVSGNVPGGTPVVFTREDLVALGILSVRADTPWTDAATLFEGPLLRDVLDAARAEGTRIEAVALNDYRVEIPMEDPRSSDMILALRVDGKSIGVRERGPLWVIYPWDTREDMRSELYYSRAIWQLKEVIVKP